LGGLLISSLQLAALSRVDLPEEERRDFFVYIDEFQTFATESFVNILAEARKFRLNLILAHQYLGQLNQNIRQAVFGNVGTWIIFRISPEDAEALTKEFEGLNIEDFTGLPNFHAYVKLLVDGYVTGPFLAVTNPPAPLPDISYKEEVIQFTRLKYSEKRSIVEARIARLFKEIEKEKSEERIVNCRVCQTPFWSKGEEVCSKCQEKSNIFVSLKEASQKGLVSEFKKEKTKVNPELDDILKLLE